MICIVVDLGSGFGNVKENTLIRYLYLRLNKGGAIFIHDYNHVSLKGVRNAVALYQNEIGDSLCKVPLADRGGSLVIVK